MTEFPFYSAVAGIFVGLAAGYIGSLMLTKRMALVGDALSHVALPGLALGILFNFNPFIGAFSALFLAAIATWYLERSTHLSIESIVGVLFVVALAVGILLTPEPDLLEALFGDISKVTLVDSVIAVAISIPVLITTRLIYQKMVLSLISEELAVSRGINVSTINFIFLFLVALVVAIGIRLVGTLLIGALVVIPAASTRNITSTLYRYSLVSGVIGVISVISGLALSSYVSLPVGPLIVLSGGVVFFGSVILGRMTGERKPAK